MSHLCVAIFVHDVAQAKRDIATAIELGADMVELRIDSFENVPGLSEIIHAFDLPFITTCRASWEGGQSDLPDADRLMLSYEADPFSERDYVDLELAAFRRLQD